MSHPGTNINEHDRLLILPSAFANLSFHREVICPLGPPFVKRAYVGPNRLLEVRLGGQERHEMIRRVVRTVDSCVHRIGRIPITYSLEER